MARKRPQTDLPVPASPPAVGQLLTDLRSLIEQTRAGVAQAANAALTMLYWQVGQRVRTDILQEKRADYGQEIVVTVSRQLAAEYGRSFEDKNLRRMIQFAELFPDQQIVVALSRDLSWSHFTAILPLKDPLQRDFYAEMCRVERWSVRALRQKIGGLLFERTALSKKPAVLARQELAKLREQDRITPDLVFRDPYFLDFLGLKDTYSEADLESAILRDLEAFILELGAGFTFVSRQKRNVHLDRLPRMADFGIWVSACEPALGWAPGTFIRAYTTNRSSANETAIEECVIGPVLQEFMAQRDTWQGTSTELLVELEKITDDKTLHRKEWPASPRKLSGDLRRIAPNVRAAGIDVAFSKSGKRFIYLGRIPDGVDGMGAESPADLPNDNTLYSKELRSPQDGPDGMDGVAPPLSETEVAESDEAVI